MIVLVLNSGSSSLKFQVIDTDLEAIEKSADKTLAQGVIERIGSEALITLRAEGNPATRSTAPLRDHRAALDKVLRWLVSPDAKVPGVASIGDIAAVGHRVVHGGEKFTKSVTIDDAVVDQIEDCIELAPLHNPANLKGIHAAREILGQGVPQVAVFDTSFHSTMPDTSYLYAIPYQLYVRHKVRRYGFHGTSHRYVAYRYRIITEKSYDDTNIITVHLGNGCSACAIQKGELDQHVDGADPSRGPRDGHAWGKYRSVDSRVPPPQGRVLAGRARHDAQQAVGSSRGFPGSPTTCGTSWRRSGCTRTGAPGSPSTSSASG